MRIFEQGECVTNHSNKHQGHVDITVVEEYYEHAYISLVIKPVVIWIGSYIDTVNSLFLNCFMV